MPLIFKDISALFLVFNNGVNFSSLFFSLVIVFMTFEMVFMSWPIIKTKPAEFLLTLDTSHVIASLILFNRLFTVLVRAHLRVFPNPKHVNWPFSFFLFPLFSLVTRTRRVRFWVTSSAKLETARTNFHSCNSFGFKFKIVSTLVWWTFDHKWRSLHKTISQ